MGALGTTTHITQYRIVDEHGFMEEINDGQGSLQVILADRLAANRFTSIADTTVEESKGWVSLFDHADTEFASGSTWIGDHLAFSLRIDKRRIPAAVLKEKVETACKFYLVEAGLAKVPKQKKTDITDAAREQLLAKAFPVPTVFDATWDLKGDIVTLYNVSVRAQEIFYDLFRRSFPELGLRLITPYDRAVTICNGLKGPGYVDALAAANKASSPDVLSLLKENAWIGTDFLSWLLWATTYGADTNAIACWVDHKITVAGCGEHLQKIAFTGDNSRLTEIKAALAQGKKIIEARIFLQQDEEEWSFTLKGDTFAFTSYRTPAVKLEKDDTVDALMERQAVFLEKMVLIGKGRDLFNQVFSAFLEQRLSGDWGKTVAGMEAWWRAEA